MRKARLLSIGFVLATSVLVLAAMSIDVEVQIAPHTLLLSSVQSGEVAVHTDIPYSIVDSASVALEGVSALRTQADDCGNFVGFFDEVEIKSIFTEVTEKSDHDLTLTGSTYDGIPFAGTDTVQVMP